MKFRKLSAVAFTAVAALTFSACATADTPAAEVVETETDIVQVVETPAATPADTPAETTGETVQCGFTISTMQNPFFVSMRDGINSAEQAGNVEVLFADANDDPLQQSNDILNFIAQGVDVAVLNPTDGDAIISSVEALNDAGIPVITVDRRAEGGDVVAHIGTDNVTAGEVTARRFFEALGDGDHKIAILEGVPGASASIDRGHGFDNVLAEFPNIEVVATQTANFQRAEGLTVAENILQAHPDLAGFLAMNDEMALGAVEAINGAGRHGEVLTIGIDGGADAIAAVANGDLVATIAQQSALMGQMGIEDCVRVAHGESIAAEQPVDVLVIDSTNVAEHQ